MEAYQQRVVDEKTELDAKLDGLNRFMDILNLLKLFLRQSNVVWLVS